MNSKRFYQWIMPISIAAMLVFGVLVYPTLPDPMPAHWNFSGEVDRYLPRWVMVLLNPGIAALLWVLTTLIPQIDPRKENYKKFDKAYFSVQAATALFLLGLHVLSLTQYDNPNMMIKAVLLGAAGLLAYIGNEMGRFRQTWFTGIRTPWTLDDERVWRKTHRVTARWMVGVSLANIVLILLLPMPVASVIFIVSVLGIAGGSFYYSYQLHQKLNG